jgi:DNA-binding LacI/PurR family transcriptional regulator
VISVNNLDRESVLVAVDRLREQGVDGVLIITALEDAAQAVLEIPDDLPVVAVEAGPDRATPVVAIDQVGGAATATRHLLELGHRTVWHVAGPANFVEAGQRVEGWQSALEAAGITPPPVLAGDWSAGSGYELGRRLAAVSEVTAVFAANDQMALGILRAFHEAGRRVPEDVSLVGFDDIPEAPYFTPPLTTLRQDFMAVGRAALELMLAEMEAPRQSPSRLVEGELIVRASTAPPR